MHKNVKRVLSFLLTFVMLLGIIPFAPQASAATADTEAASDMLAGATYAWSAQDWTGAGQFSYASDSNVTSGENSLRSWRFSTTEQSGSSYARLQISLQKSYDMTGKDLVFDVKADPANELTSYSIGIVPYASDWKPVHDYTNYQEYQVYFTGSDWTTVTVDNSILKAYLQDGRDISDIFVLYLSFYFPAGAQNIYIDNMRLVDHNYGTDAQDAAADLLANAEIVENGANGSTYTYEHTNKTVAYGNESNASHKFSASANASDMFTVKYDLGKSYDLSNRNLVMDILSYRGGNGFAFSLYNSKNELVSYAESYTTVNQWAKVTPAILAGLQNGKSLSDVRYVAIGARFAANTSRADRAFYFDNLRIEDIDVHSTALQGKNIVFMGDSITAAYGYKGWAGEMQEHYRINPYNIGVGGASFATLSGRTTIYAQTANIPNTDVDFFVLNGGVNDIWSKANLGAVSDVSVTNATVNSFDTNTTAGAMEQMFCYLTKNYPDSKIAFLINYFCYSVEIDNIRFRDEFAPLAKEICEKWGITWIDLTDNTEINALRGVHTYDGVHGNDIAYELVMRELAPVLATMCDATEQTEQNSDLLAYATYAWSAENWNGNLSYDAACTNVFGSESTRSWKFSASAAQTGNAGIQLMLHNLHNFTLTGKKLAFDVKFESSNGQSAQDIGLRLYDRTWKSVTGDNTVWVGGNGSTQWQTITVDASVFAERLASGCDLNEIMLVYFQFNFADNAGNEQNVYIDNFRVVDSSASNATEETSDLLYGAGFVEGSISGEGMGYEQFNTALTYGADSKYSYRFYIEDDKTAWTTATFMLPESIDLTKSTLQFDVNQYNQVALWVDLFDSNYKEVTGDNYTLRDIGWQTYEINSLYGLAEGRTAADLSDIRYIRFSFNFAPANTGRTVVIDNLTTYKNEQYSSMAAGLNGLYLGDSVSEATNYKGWHGEMAEHYGITGYNVSVGGRTLANDGIYSELDNVPADMKFDFIMLDGGVNDYWAAVAPGNVTPEGTTSFDATTPVGGLEKLFYTFRTQYPDAEIFYIILYLPNWTSFYKDAYVNDFLPLAKQACEKWGVHVLDLTSNSAFLEEFDVTAEVHTFDGLHANKEGFDIITPYVVSMLEEAMCADASVRYQQLSLGDDLSMRFDIAVSGAYADIATVNVTVDGNSVLENVSYTSLADGVSGCKKFTLDMAAAQMSDEIVITISDGDAVLVEKTYTVRDYIKTLIEGNYDAKLQELAKAALNYGAGAQVYFDHNADTLANTGYESTEVVEIPEINTENMISGEVSGIRFYGASLVYTSKIAVRYYFTVNGDMNSYTFSSGNAPILKDGKYYVEIDGINPQEYAKEIALTVSNGTEEMTVTYSPLYYISRMYNKTDKQSLKTLLGAMYNYHIAAVDYVTQEVIRGAAFTAGKSTIFDIEDGVYDIVSFDYKIDGEGEIAAIIRGTEWLKFYGDYRLTAEGEKTDYLGITTEKLSDGYIRVTFDLAALDRSGCINNRDGAPSDVSLIDIYDWTTANGYIDNIQVSNKEPEEVIRGERFTAGKDTFFYVETGSYKYVTFDYKPDSAGELAVIIRGSSWTKYFGDFRLTENGEKVDYAGVTTEILPDGYIRATFELDALDRSGCVNNREGAPTDVALIDIYNGTTVDGYLDNIQLSNEVPEEETPGTGELVTVTFADVQLMTEHRGNTVNGPKTLKDHLTYAKSIDADVLFMPGDVVNNAVQSYYDRFWTIFKSVYGEDESQWPEIIWAMGNHEWYDTNELNATDAIALFKANAYMESLNLVKVSQVASEANPGQTVANYYKVVNGVPFVVISGDSRANTVTEAQKAELITWLDEINQLPSVQAGTPIYVAYHLPIADVTYFGQGASEASKTVDEILKNYPNAIVFTGDTHCPGINERTINQIDYTAINLGSSSYSRIVSRSATSQEGDKYYNVGGNAKDVVTGEVAFGFTYTQNLMVLENNIDGSVVMNRYMSDTDPADIRKVGITWNFPSGLTKEQFIYTYDRFENKEWANTLYGKDGLVFPEDASISFSVDGTEMMVYFDDVTDHNYAEHYKITITADGVNSKTYDLVGNYFKYYEESQTYHFQLSDIPTGTNYKVEVKAYDFFDNESLNSLVATTESETSLFPDKVDNAIAGTYTDISTKVNYEVTAGGVSSLECYYRGDYLYTYGATLGTILDKSNLTLAEEFTVTDWNYGVLTMKVKNAGDVAINVGLTVVVNENGTEKWVTDFGGEYRKVVAANSEWVELSWNLNELFGIDALNDIVAIRLKVSSTAPSADGYTMHLHVDDIDVVQGEGDDTDEPVPVNRGKAFSAGVDNFFYLDTAGDYDTLSFDYKTDGSGEIAVIFRGSKWTTYYGDFRLTEKGEKVDYVGITTEVLEDGYIRATFNLKELQRSGCEDNRNNAPVDVALIDLYNWTTVNGYIDNITVS